MAIRRGDQWVFDPDADTVLSEGDVLLFHGPEDGVNLIREIAGAPPLPEPPEVDLPALTELDRAVDILIEMKNSSEVAVGLAYSALLFQHRALAAEVAALEARSDILHDELESWVLKAAPEARNTDELRGLLRLAYAGEIDLRRGPGPDVADRARRGRSTPSSRWRSRRPTRSPSETLIEEGSRAAGRSLKELQVETETGMFVLAVQRGRRWIYRPRPRFEFQAGDRVIAIGPEEGVLELDALAARRPAGRGLGDGDPRAPAGERRSVRPPQRERAARTPRAPRPPEPPRPTRRPTRAGTPPRARRAARAPTRRPSPRPSRRRGASPRRCRARRRSGAPARPSTAPPRRAGSSSTSWPTPMTRTTSARAATAFTASCRFCVA